MRRRFVDTDITISVAVTVTDTLAKSITRRRFALHQSANDSEPGAAAGHGDARKPGAFRRRAGAALE
jgi:hypothetical protein